MTELALIAIAIVFTASFGYVVIASE